MTGNQTIQILQPNTHRQSSEMQQERETRGVARPIKSLKSKQGNHSLHSCIHIKETPDWPPNTNVLSKVGGIVEMSNRRGNGRRGDSVGPVLSRGCTLLFRPWLSHPALLDPHKKPAYPPLPAKSSPHWPLFSLSLLHLVVVFSYR